MWSISQIKLSSIEKIRIRSLRTQPLGFLRRKQTWNKSDRGRKGWRWKQQRKQQCRQEHLLARAKAFNIATVFIVSTACQAAATQGTHQYQSSHKGFELLKMRSKTSRSLTTAWHESWKQVRQIWWTVFQGSVFRGTVFFVAKRSWHCLRGSRTQYSAIWRVCFRSPINLLTLQLRRLYNVQCTLWIDRPQAPHTDHPGSGSGSHGQTTMTSVLRILWKPLRIKTFRFINPIMLKWTQTQ